MMYNNTSADRNAGHYTAAECAAHPDMYMDKTHTNNTMNLALIVRIGGIAIFARLNGDGSVYDYVVGHGCHFKGDTVTWNWGHYDLSYEDAFKVADRLSK